MNPVVYYITSTLTYGMVILLACVVPNVDFIFGIIGANAVAFIVFFGPAGFFLRGAVIENKVLTTGESVGAWLWLALGAVICIWCNFCVFYSTFAS